jgi:thiol:disulfide interchange protein DsbD
VIIVFSGIFILMALSLFGVYQMHLPSRWQQRLTHWSNRQKGGTYIGVFLMGSISSLIVSPCISPPLVGVLAYIAQTGNVWLGASALLALGIGMGIPLLVIGVSHGRLLPKAGHWMVTVERLTGVIMLAFAIWMLSRIIPGSVALSLWAFLLMGVAIFLGNFFHGLMERHRLRRSLALLVFLYGIILLVGAVLGNSDPLQPWANIRTVSAKKESEWMLIKSMPQFESALLQAKQNKQLVIVDFYADWCASCIKMDRDVFSKTKVQDALAGMLLLRVDMTDNDAFDQALMQRYHVIAPPTLLFFTKNSVELNHHRMVGEMNASEFIRAITTIKNKESGDAH